LRLQVPRQSSKAPSRRWLGRHRRLLKRLCALAHESLADYLHFLDRAYGSAREVEYQVSLAFRLGFLREPAHQELSALTVETSKVLNGLLRSLRKQ